MSEAESLFLSNDEVRRLTSKVRFSAQIRALRTMGIDHIIRPDGRPIVPVRAVPFIERKKDNKKGEVKMDLSML